METEINFFHLSVAKNSPKYMCIKGIADSQFIISALAEHGFTTTRDAML